jgi:putative addiction module CopG family antidote
MPTRKTMNVSLTPELERSVANWVASGRYRTASEVVRAALRLLEKEEGAGQRGDSCALPNGEGSGGHAR